MRLNSEEIKADITPVVSGIISNLGERACS